MGSKSKQKGAGFERFICKELSKWITNNQREDLFWRSAMSGGRATLYTDKSKVGSQAGDISAIDSAGQWLVDRYFVECKFYAKIGLDSYLYSNKGTLAEFLREVSKQAKQYKKKFLLIFKENNRPITVISDDPVFTKFKKSNRLVKYPEKYSIFSFDLLLSKPYNIVKGDK